MARHIAKQLVAADYCDRAELQLSYAIGHQQPVAVQLDCFGTETRPLIELIDLIERSYDLSPAGIIDSLELRRPIYRQTAAYGHFGKPDLPREQLTPTLSA